MMYVDVDHVMHLISELRKINKLPLEEIRWVKGEEEIFIPKSEIEEFRFTGLSNTNFVEFYLESSEEEE